MASLQLMTRSAIGNARAAVGALARDVADRMGTAPVPDDDDAPAGALRLLDTGTCWDLLASRRVGRYVFMARRGTPDVAVVNHVVDGRTVLVRSGPGPKLQAAERGDLVALEVDELDEESRTGWSVVLVGRAERVTAYDAVHLAVPEPWAAGPRSSVVRITPVRITGRRLGRRAGDRATPGDISTTTGQLVPGLRQVPSPASGRWPPGR